MEYINNNFENAFNNFESSVESCQTDCAPSFVLAYTYQEVMLKHILIPAKSGFYFTRLDIKKLANTCNESIQIDDRKRMMEQFIKVVDGKAKFEQIATSLKNAINSKIKIYEEMIIAYPQTKDILNEMVVKANNSIKLLDKTIEEFE